MSVVEIGGHLVIISGTALAIGSGGSGPYIFDYFVSTTGNDSNPGTLISPWAVTSFVSGTTNWKKMPGKKIGLIAGNYILANYGIGDNPGGFADAVISVPGGSSAASTIVASCDTNGNYSARASTITWSGAALNAGLIGNNTDGGGFGFTYITYDGVIVNGGPLAGTVTGSTNGHLFNFYANYTGGSSGGTQTSDGVGWVIKNCEIYGIAQQQSGANLGGIFLAGGVNALIQNCYIHDINVVPGGSGAGGQTSHCGGYAEIACYGTQIVNCTFANCTNSHGIWIKEYSTGGTVSYCYFYNCANPTFSNNYCAALAGGGDGNPFPANAGQPSNTQNYSYHHNVIDNCGAERTSGNFPQEFTIPEFSYNNTVYSVASTLGWGMSMFTDTNGGASSAGYANYYNNIYYSVSNTGNNFGNQREGRINVNPGAANGGTAGTGTNNTGFITLNNNCYYCANGNYTNFWGYGNNYPTSFANWQSAISAIVANSENASIQSNPLFTTGTSGGGPEGFQLGSSSPCIASGIGGVNMGAWDGTGSIGCGFGPYA